MDARTALKKSSFIHSNPGDSGHKPSVLGDSDIATPLAQDDDLFSGSDREDEDDNGDFPDRAPAPNADAQSCNPRSESRVVHPTDASTISNYNGFAQAVYPETHTGTPLYLPKLEGQFLSTENRFQREEFACRREATGFLGQPQTKSSAEVARKSIRCGCDSNGRKCACTTGECGCGNVLKQGPILDKSCGCNGRANQCSCLPGTCDCTECECGKNDDSDTNSVPMDIGKTPITPTFPSMGMVRHPEDTYQDPDSSQDPKLAQTAYNLTQKPTCNCICGETCACVRGQCNCDIRQAPSNFTQPPFNGGMLTNKPLGSLIREAVEIDDIDAYHPTHLASPTRRAVSVRSNTSSPLSFVPRTTALGSPVRRPDTPRPFNDAIRQSVEPETLPRIWNRQSTPAYEDRSPSPSPVSYTDDTPMRDVTPTYLRECSMPPPSTIPHNSAPFNHPHQQEVSPGHSSLSNADYSSDQHTYLCGQAGAPPIARDNSHWRMNDDLQTQDAHVLGHKQTHNEFQTLLPKQQVLIPPPIPQDEIVCLKTRKPSGKARRKSIIVDSGITKPKSRATSRKVTGKPTKSTTEKSANRRNKDESKVAATMKKMDSAPLEAPAKESKEKDSKAWEAEFDEKTRRDGTPVRRSGRKR